MSSGDRKKVRLADKLIKTTVFLVKKLDNSLEQIDEVVDRTKREQLL